MCLPYRVLQYINEMDKHLTNIITPNEQIQHYMSTTSNATRSVGISFYVTALTPFIYTLYRQINCNHLSTLNIAPADLTSPIGIVNKRDLHHGLLTFSKTLHGIVFTIRSLFI